MITLFNLIYYVALATMVSSIPLCKVALILCVCVWVRTLQCVHVEVRGQFLRIRFLLLHGFQDQTHAARHKSTCHDLLIENASYFSEDCRGLRDLSKLSECSCHCVRDRARIRIWSLVVFYLKLPSLLFSDSTVWIPAGVQSTVHLESPRCVLKVPGMLLVLTQAWNLSVPRFTVGLWLCSSWCVSTGLRVTDCACVPSPRCIVLGLWLGESGDSS